VSLEQAKTEPLPATPLSPLLHREACDAAGQWLARFEPLLGELDALTADEVRERLRRIDALESDAGRVLGDLEAQATASDTALLATLRQAVRELESLEEAHRRRLGLLAPGDPAAGVDLARLQEKLAASAARREVQAWTGSSLNDERLAFPTSQPSWPAALFLGIFALGWNSFTTVHAIFMIGGMFHSFGWPALFLLAFYAIFWTVGLAMAAGAVFAACSEEVALEGRELVIRRTIVGRSWSRRRTLSPESRAYLAVPNLRQEGSVTMEIAIPDHQGREVRFGGGRPRHEQQRIIEQINARLSAL
jgi:hypothetical protein